MPMRSCTSSRGPGSLSRPRSPRALARTCCDPMVRSIARRSVPSSSATPRRGVAEDEGTERLAIDRTIGSQQVRAKARGDLGRERLPGPLELVHDRIGIDHAGTELLEESCDGALAGADAPGETDRACHCWEDRTQRTIGSTPSLQTTPSPSARTQFLPCAFAR